MARRIILIRHSESTKNTQDVFGDENAVFELTEQGKVDSMKLAKRISEISNDSKKKIMLFTSPDIRSLRTTEIISKELGCAFKVKDTLLPIKAGKLSGISEYEAYNLYPKLMKQKQSFRAGNLNGYEIAYPDGENVAEFQSRVLKDFENIISLSNELLFLITHQSVITAILSSCKAKMNNAKYYYYFKIKLCSFSQITISNSNCCIDYVNAE